MKNLTIITFLILNVFSSSSFAETITTKIAANKQWSSYILVDHSAWGTEACIASTSLPDAVLEVYSEKVAGAFTEPTVQILFAGAPQAFSAEASTGALKKWSLTLASAPQDPTLQAIIVRLSDRENFLASLKRDNAVTVKVRDARGKLLKTLQFSLSGSSKTIDAQIQTCQLKFEDL